ncbi:MAG TPA: hypothetical protein VEZ40_19455, partial [Pyrinomonadaceae bacterium]|nr:hypothetical protein [Pyrinomonadaceae bacterium]
ATEELSLFPGLLPPLLAFAALVLFNWRTRGERRNEQADARNHPPPARRAWRTRLAVPFKLRPLLLLDAFAVGAGIVALLISGYGTIDFRIFSFHLVTATRPAAAFTACLAAVVVRAAITFLPLIRRVAAGRLNARAGDGERSVETFAVGAIWLSIGFIGSLGMHAFFHKFLFEHFEVFKSQRIPARWSMICYVGLALLAGLGARALAARLAGTRRPARRALVCALIVIALLFELRVAPLVVMRGEAYPDELTLRLKETPMHGGLVELPATAMAIFTHMIRAADHEKPIVTAASSFLPPLMRRIESLSQQRPAPAELLDVIESAPASYLVIHYAYMSPAEIAATDPLLRQGLDTGRLRFIRSYHDRGRKDLYAVTKTEPAAQSESHAPPELVAPAAPVAKVEDAK